MLRAITAYGRTAMERTQSNDCRDRRIRGHWPRAMTHVTETRHDPNTTGACYAILACVCVRPARPLSISYYHLNHGSLHSQGHLSHRDPQALVCRRGTRSCFRERILGKAVLWSLALYIAVIFCRFFGIMFLVF